MSDNMDDMLRIVELYSPETSDTVKEIMGRAMSDMKEVGMDAISLLGVSVGQKAFMQAHDGTIIDIVSMLCTVLEYFRKELDMSMDDFLDMYRLAGEAND